MRFLFLFFLLASTVPAVAADGGANAVFLVAKRGMRDPNFEQTVVLITQPQRGGAWGVIINRPLDHPLSEVFREHAALKGRKDTLFFGGPVRREGLVFLVQSAVAPARATQLLRDVFFTGDAEFINGLLQRPDPTRGLRVYSGHAGWAPGQLQSEIAAGGWHIVPADAEVMFDKDPARIWPELIERATTRRTGAPQGGRPTGREGELQPPELPISRSPVF